MNYPKVVTGYDRVAIDLDGTLAEVTWPGNEVGPILPHARDMLQHYADQGFGIVIYTARPTSHEAKVWQWLEAQGLDHLVWEVVCGKPIAGLYIDDLAVNVSDIIEEAPWQETQDSTPSYAA